MTEIEGHAFEAKAEIAKKIQEFVEEMSLSRVDGAL